MKHLLSVGGALLLVMCLSFSAQAQQYDPVALSIPDQFTSAGASLVVPVEMVNGDSVKAIQLVIRYDPDSLNVTNAVLTTRATAAGFAIVGMNLVEVGDKKELRLSAYDNTPTLQGDVDYITAGSGAVVDLSVTVTAVPASMVFVDSGDAITKIIRSAEFTYELTLDHGLFSERAPKIALVPPDTLKFGNVDTAWAATDSVVIKNTGSDTLIVSKIVAPVTAQFSVQNVTGLGMVSLPDTILVGDSTKVAVKFSPTALGTVTDSLGVVSNVSPAPDTVYVTLTGTGIAAAEQVDLGAGQSQQFNDFTGEEQYLNGMTLTAPDGQSVSIGLVAPDFMEVGGDGALTGTGGHRVVSAVEFTVHQDFGDACLSVELPVDPNILAGQGFELANLVLAFYNPITGTFDITGIQNQLVDIQGATVGACLSHTSIVVVTSKQVSAASVDSVDFGVVDLPASKDTTIVIKNTGGLDLTITGFSFKAGTGVFSVQSPVLSPDTTIAGGDSLQVTLRFDPAAPVSYRDTLRIASNDPDMPNLDIPLKGTGTGEPGIVVVPDSVGYGIVLVGTPDVDSVYVKNTGTVPLTVTGLTGVDAPFVVDPTVLAALPLEIAAGESTWVKVTFTPAGVGPVADTLVVVSDAPAPDNQKLVKLTGEGLSPAIVKINEVLADPPGTETTDLEGDANQDGTRSASDDEFVELVNTGDGTGSLAGWMLKDESGTGYTFPADVTIDPNEYIVVFGGGDSSAVANKFPGIQIFVAGGTIGDGISNTDDTVYLSDAQGAVKDSLSNSQVTGGWAKDQSVTRDPDRIGTTFVKHGEAPGVRLFSPGKARALLAEIILAPEDTTVTLGSTFQLAASGVLTNPDTVDITTKVTWTSADANIAKVNAAGLVTAARDTGTTTIYAERTGRPAVNDTLLKEGATVHVEYPEIALSVDAPDSVKAGDTFEAQIIVGNVVDLGAYEFVLSFPKGIVRADSVKDAGFLGSTGRTVRKVQEATDDSSATLAYATDGLEPAGPSGSDTLATVYFTALAGQDEVILDLHNVLLTRVFGPVLPVAVNDDTMKVEAAVKVLVDAPDSVTAGTEDAAFEAHILVDNVAGLGAYEFVLSFPKGIVRADSVKDAGFLGSTGRTVRKVQEATDDSTATLAYATDGLEPAGPSGSDTLATVYLTALAGQDEVVLHLDDVMLTTVPGEVMTLTEVRDDTMKVKAVPFREISGKVTYYGNPDKPVTDVALTLEEMQVADTVTVAIDTTIANGSYVFTEAAPGKNYRATPSKGELGGPDPVNITDAVFILQYLGLIMDLDAHQMLAGNVNNDPAGVVNITDAVFILQKLGLIMTMPFPGGYWVFEPVSRSYVPLEGDSTGQDYVGIVRADLNGSWVPSGGAGKLSGPASLPVSSSVLSLREGEERKAGTLPVQVVMSQADGIFGANIQIEYPSDALTVKEVNLGALAADYLMVSNATVPGMIHLVMAGARALGESGSIAEIEFEVLDGTGRFDLHILDAVVSDGKQELRVNVDGVLSALPEVASLSQNYPNPFNPETVIEFAIPRQSGQTAVTLRIYSVTGQTVRRLLDDEQMEPGFHEVSWDGRDDVGESVGAGVYIYHIVAGDFIATRKMVLLK